MLSHSFRLLIVVPTLNSHHLLPRLVSSLQSQSWHHWRVLFVDGPSDSVHRNWIINCCASDSRFSFIEQDSSNPGIFGAMNYGFSTAGSSEWLLFWGSDDLAADCDVFKSAFDLLDSYYSLPDLLICTGRYFSSDTTKFGRRALFRPLGFLSSATYNRALMFGSIPPHQCTLFGPGSRDILHSFDTNFSLSADLDYFLKLGYSSDLCVLSTDLELVHMSDSGVSGQQTKRRLFEVRRAYSGRYGFFWWLPFVSRYIRRIFGLIYTY